MKRVATVLSMLLVLSVVLTAAAPLALADESVATPNSPITWTPPGLIVPVAPGETEHASATFVSQTAIANASLLVSFPLSRYAQVTPHGPLQVVAGTAYPVDLTIALPEQGAPAVIAGMVQIMGQRRAYGAALLVTITRANPRPPIRWTPSEVKLWVNPPAPTAAATVPVTTTSVSFTSAVTITNAHIRATAPLDRVVDLSEHGPITLTPGVTYTLVMTAHEPAETAALDSVAQSSAQRIVSGMVEVFDAHRVYPHNLPVSVVIGPRPVQATITWRPPLVSMVLTPGQVLTRVVTMSTNYTVTNASLSVTGAITPYVTLSSGQTAPFTLSPHTAYPVTLTVTSHAAPPLNRALMGSVVVKDSSGHAYRYDLKVVLLWRHAAPTPTPPVSPLPRP